MTFYITNCQTCLRHELRAPQVGSNTRLVGKHCKYDYALNRQTKRYFAEERLLATRLNRFDCSQSGPCEELTYVQGDHLGKKPSS